MLDQRIRHWANIKTKLGSSALSQNCTTSSDSCITFVQRRPNVFDVGPTLYKCYTNVLASDQGLAGQVTTQQY